MKSVVVLVVLAACAHTCLAVPAPATEAAPVVASAVNPSAAPAAAKPEEPAAPAIPAVPAVPVEPAAAKPPSTASPTPAPAATPAAAAPAVPVAAAPPAADVANKMRQLVAVPALNSTKGAISVQVATADNPSCSEDRQCVRMLNSATGPEGPAVCVAGKCMCRYDHVFENGTCVHKQARGKSCAADAECADLDGGACLQGVCGCKPEYVPAVAANKCLPVQRSLAAVCEEDIQCSEGLGDLGRCSAGKCACPEGAALAADNKCACAADEELNKAANRCERAAPGKQMQQQQPAPAQEGQLRNNKGGAGSLQSSMAVVTALLACAAYSFM